MRLACELSGESLLALARRREPKGHQPQRSRKIESRGRDYVCKVVKQSLNRHLDS
jgi:hypothetical protein